MNDDVPFGVEVLDRLTRDPRVRRELLWLRAMEKGDLMSVRDLESVDPELRGRLAPFVEENAAAIAHDPRQAFASMQDRWYAKRARELGADP
jgi:hypothetical protein